MTQTKKVMVIVNPCSGKTHIHNHINDINDEMMKNGLEPTMFVTSGFGDAERFAQKLSEEFDIVACRGGDGTLNEVINGMMRAKTMKPIGYIPAGTTNDFARSMNIPTDTQKAIQLIANGVAYPHDVGRFNEMFFNYTAAFGLFSKASYATPQKQKNMFGNLAYFFQGAKEAGNIKVIPTKVICDGKDYSGDYVFGTVTNSLSVGNVLKYDKKLVNFSDGMFEMLLAKKPTSFMELVRLVGSVRRKEIDEKYLTFVQGRDFYFEFEEEIPWTLDGEYGGAHKINNVRCYHDAVSIFKSFN